jgi:signal transduction histidine kinase
MSRLRHLDIQTKIILVLIGVIVPTFLVVTLLENKLAKPILEDEMRQIGISSAESLATKIVSNKWLSRPNMIPRIENEIQDLLYYQRAIVRMDVYAKDPPTGTLKLVTSNVEEEVGSVPVPQEVVDKITSERLHDDERSPIWDIRVPIRLGGSSARSVQRSIGIVHVLVSLKGVNRLVGAFWKITFMAAGVSMVVLMVVLSFFLRKTVANERKLRRAEDENLLLSRQLHEAERQLMNVEKLAVMGQLTANLAHEIGTPLNAIGGHLQLLRDELAVDKAAEPRPARSKERFEIIGGELTRIEKIVKNFLQTTAKPVSQSQLIDVNGLVDKTIGIVRPRIDGMGLELQTELDRRLGPLRVVPLDVEQILLNLLSNSLDSIQAKARETGRPGGKLEIGTKIKRQNGTEWAEILVHDSGQGISRENLKNVTKPFFTTKRPGEGTGLGLTICQQLASKYGGVLEIDSKEGAWAEVRLRLPYRQAG